MSVEAGAKIGMIAPDDTTYAYPADRPAHTGDDALAYWRTLPSDKDAAFAREIDIDVSRFAPMVISGTSPEDCSPIDGHVPDPAASPIPIVVVASNVHSTI
jgi:3-isopropylmalate/(R)-2-methylmalate dehydratase large subunit